MTLTVASIVGFPSLARFPRRRLIIFALGCQWKRTSLRRDGVLLLADESELRVRMNTMYAGRPPRGMSELGLKRGDMFDAAVNDGVVMMLPVVAYPKAGAEEPEVLAASTCESAAPGHGRDHGVLAQGVVARHDGCKLTESLPTRVCKLTKQLINMACKLTKWPLNTVCKLTKTSSRWSTCHWVHQEAV
jgi:hypothetical protein